MLTLLRAFTLLAALLSPSITTAAEVTWSRGQIWVEGAIERGDFEKFRSALKEAGSEARLVSLVSSRGDEIEAMKIGELVRKLFLGTEASLVVRTFEGEVLIDCRILYRYHPHLALASFCIEPLTNESLSRHGCSSACFLIWVAGISRNGHALGIHRPRFDPAYFAGLSAKDADEKYRQMLGGVKDYLSRMDVPPHYFDKMLTIPADQIESLNENHVRAELSGKIPSFEEWIIAQCGLGMTEEERQEILHLAFKKYEGTILNPQEDARQTALHKKDDDHIRCVSNSLRPERERTMQGM